MDKEAVQGCMCVIRRAGAESDLALFPISGICSLGKQELAGKLHPP